MNQVEIILVSPQQGKLDVDKNSEVPFTFGISDIRDVTQKKGAFSKTIKLAGTKNNNTLLNNYYDVNVEAGTFNINKLQKVQILQNGTPILQDAFMQLVSINKVQNIINTEAFVEYDVLVKDNVSDLFTAINNLKLSDLEFGNYDHIFNADNIVNTFDNTWEDGYKYFVPYKNQITYVLDEFKPAIFAKTYFDKILNGAGFSYEWETLSASTVQFDKLLIPFVGDGIKINNEYNDEVKVIAINSASTLYDNVTAVDLANYTEIQDQLGLFNPTTGVYTNNTYSSGEQSITWKLEVEYEFYLHNYSSGIAYLKTLIDDSDQGLAYRDYMPSITLNLNGSDISVASFQQESDYYRVSQTDPLTLGPTQISALGDRPMGSGIQVFTLAAQNTFPAQLFKNRLITVQTPGAGNVYNGVWKLGDGSLAVVNPMVRIVSINLTIQQNTQNISYGQLMKMNLTIPNLKQSEFVKSIMTMYNLYTVTDPLQPNKLIFKHRDDFYDEGLVLDWTTKIAKDKDQVLTLLPDITNRFLKLTYKQDNGDVMLKGYLDSTTEIYGQIEYKFDNEYQRGTDVKEISFSPMVLGETDFSDILPFYDGRSPKYSPKIALNSKQIDTANPLTIYNYIASGVSTGSSVTFTSVPFIGHFDDPLNPSFDINFGANDYYFYELENITNNNLFNLFWRRTANQINEGRMLTAYFKLNENDINQLKLNEKIFVNNAYWHINQIIDYKAGRKDLTKVELILADDELQMVPFLTKPLVNIIYGKHKKYIQEYTQEQRDNSNIVVGNNPAIINGWNNFVSTNSGNSVINGNNNTVGGADNIIYGNNNSVISNTFVYGSNNYIPEGVNNAIVIGNGISATTGNTLYTNNIVLSSGGTINGVPTSAITSLNIWEVGSGTNSAQLVGGGANASGTYAVAEGSGTTANGNASHAEGRLTTANSNYSHAEGGETTALGAYSHAGGWLTIAIGIASHSEGLSTTASGAFSHAEGGGTTASGSTSHAEGFQTQALGDHSHSEGGYTIASDLYGHAEGGFTIASGQAAHAEGTYTTAIGDHSHSEGSGTTASGFIAHAEGISTTAIGDHSHSEGYYTIAFGDDSHAEGYQTRALSQSDHAEGYQTTASGVASHAGGMLAIADNVTSFTRGIVNPAVSNNVLAQIEVIQWAGATTSNTITSLDLYNGNNYFILAQDIAMFAEVTVVGRETSTGDAVSFAGNFMLSTDAGVLIYDPFPVVLTQQFASAALTTAGASVTVTASDLVPVVQGPVGTNIEWAVVMKITTMRKI